MRKLLLVVPLLLLGCTQSGYTISVKAGSDIATGINAGMTAIDQTRINGLISASEELQVLGFLKYANDADAAFFSCSTAANTAGSKAGTFTACAMVFNSALNNPTELALIHVSNPTAQATINTLIQGILTGVNAVITALGGK